MTQYAPKKLAETYPYRARIRFLDNLLSHIMNYSADRCSHLKMVSKPVTHNSRQLHFGAWMKDPLGIMGTDTIFVMEGYHSRKEVEEFKNMEDFKAGIVLKKHTLPYNYDGTGSVVYGPYLYYSR